MILFFALLLDWFLGDPESLWKRIPHPVVIIGSAIDYLDRKFNHPNLDSDANRGRGILALLVLVAGAVVGGAALSTVFSQLGILGWALEVLVVAIFIAQKSLADHVRRVAIAIRSDGLEAGQLAVSQIVGRDTKSLDQAGICRAAIESLAENFSDGVVAPVFWYAIFGLPGLVAYKAINTADSMIGHKNTRYGDFGRATALLDDLVNWPAARLSALLISIATTLHQGILTGWNALSKTLQEAGTHRSPNAGWPETAMAASLDIPLGGPRVYGDKIAREPILNASATRQASVADIDRALEIFRTSCIVLWAFVAVIALVA